MPKSKLQTTKSIFFIYSLVSQDILPVADKAELTLANTLARALGMPRDAEPNVTKTALLRPTDSEAKPSTTPRRDRGNTYRNSRKHA